MSIEIRRLTRNRASAYCPACEARVTGQYCAVMSHLKEHNEEQQEAS
jgi:hypothetical protein